MAKLKTPLLSLGAQGTINDSITFARRRHSDIAELKPETPNKRTLAQMYQRWLYQDYAYRWSQQTAATKATYAALAARHHSTPIAEWLSEYLTTLPDIAGAWHFEQLVGGNTPDWSKNANSGIVVGALKAEGIISHCLKFDGIDDNVNCGNKSALNPSYITIEAFIKPLSTKISYIFVKGWAYAGAAYYLATTAANKLVLVLGKEDNTYTIMTTTRTLTIDQWQHVAATYNGSKGYVYWDGVPDPTSITVSPPKKLGASTANTWIAGAGVGNRFHGYIDEPRLTNRALDQTEVINHSQRRYP